jgi:hypothetical protein
MIDLQEIFWLGLPPKIEWPVRVCSLRIVKGCKRNIMRDVQLIVAERSRQRLRRAISVR